MTGLPFLPFTRPTIDEATIAGVADVLRSGWITTGPMVREFESALSQCIEGRRVRSLNSGTAALEIGLRVAGVGPGDEVITTPVSFVATAGAIAHVGATPIFADVKDDQTLDPQAIEKAITPRTKAIMQIGRAHV